MMLWRRSKEDPTVRTPAELQKRTDEIVAQFRDVSREAKIITTRIKQQVDVLEAHRGT